MLTVIIPVYNSEKYVENCLASILQQTYIDFEIIIVDDGSTDNSLEICQAYAEKDKRIKVFTKENGGQSSARNVGLKMATGRFISFIDSDDEISNEVFANAIKAFASDEDIDIVQFPVFMNYGLSTQYLNQKKEQKITGRKNLFQEWIEKNNISWIVCNKIFKIEIFDQLRFEKMYYEDNYMVAEVLGKINVLKIIEQGIYYYHHRENSTTTSAHSFEKERDTQKVNFKIYKSLKEHNVQPSMTIIQERIINVGLSLYRNYRKELTLFHKNEISLSSLRTRKINLRQKLKILLYLILGKNMFR